MSDKARENRLRRMAERQGLALRKSRSRDPQSPEYRKYQIVEPGKNEVVTGGEPHEFSLSLDDIESWLTNDEATPQASVVESPFHTREASAGSKTRTSDDTGDTG